MNIKRILVFALALAILAMPVGLAEGLYGSLTLSNFHVDATGMEEPLDIDASLKLGLGGQLPDGPGRLDIELIGGGQTAFTGSASFDKDAVRAVLGGASFYFEVPMETLKALAEGAMSGDLEGAPSMDEIQKVGDLFGRYVALIEKYSDPQKAAPISAAVFSVFDIEEKGKETVDMFGNPMELNRFDIRMTGSDIGKMYDAIFAADPEIKALVDDYFKLIGELSREPFPITADSMGTFLDAQLKESGVEMVMDMSVWTDTASVYAVDAKAVKEAVTVSVTAPKESSISFATPDPEAKPEMETVTFPMTVSVLESDQGTRMAYAMNVEPEEGEALNMSFDGTFDAPAPDGGTVSEGVMAFDFKSKSSNESYAFNISGNQTVSKDGVTDFSLTMNGEGGGEAVDLGIAYDGETATAAEKSGVFRFNFNAPVEGVPMKVDFSCDTLVETGAFSPLGDADFAGLTKVDPLTADEETQTQMQTELQGIMLQAMGVLMQTPGLSNIMGGMMG